MRGGLAASRRGAAATCLAALCASASALSPHPEAASHLGTHANLLTREGAKNVLASMLGCGVRAMDYCGYPESMPNQRVITGPDPEYRNSGGRLFRSYAIPTHTVLIQGDLDSDIGP